MCVSLTLINQGSACVPRLPRPTNTAVHGYKKSSRSVGLIINTRLTQRVCLRGDWNLDYPLLHCFAFLFRFFLNISALSALLRGLRGNNVPCTMFFVNDTMLLMLHSHLGCSQHKHRNRKSYTKYLYFLIKSCSNKPLKNLTVNYNSLLTVTLYIKIDSNIRSCT